MNLVADMKMLHAKKFKEGSIKQATFLKSFKNDIFELICLNYKPSEIKDYLEEKLDVCINMNSFYAWLNYTKDERESKQYNNNISKIIVANEIEKPSGNDTKKPTNTLDVLSSTDFD